MASLSRVLGVLLVLSLLASSLAGCASESATPSPEPATTSTATASESSTPAPTEEPEPADASSTPDSTAGTTVLRGAFAAYEPVPVKGKPMLAPYSISAGLKNVGNASDFDLSPAEKDALAKMGFFVRPAEHKEFFHLYEDSRYQEVPVFVTTDSTLHVYHLLFDKLLRSAERRRFVPALSELTDSMLAGSLGSYAELRGTPLESASRRNAAFFAVAAELLSGPAGVPPEIKSMVDAELSLIEAHEGIVTSPIFGYPEDYSQYVPRGHYTKSDDLKTYFKVMMWYGRMTFRLKSMDPAAGRDETLSALLLVNQMRNSNSGNALANWELIYEPTSFFVGTSDDLTLYEYAALMDEVYGSAPSASDLAEADKLSTFIDRASKLRPPQINSMVVDEDEDRQEAIKGFRLMGQRFVLDAGIFQRLIYREVIDRYLPKGLDVMAAFGSEEAYSILEDEGDTAYPNYVPQMEKVRTIVAGVPGEQWTSNLYWGWLDALRALLQPRGEGYPSFMQGQAWVRKDLNTALGSWAELKHDTILYAKQVYAEAGGGPEGQTRGYVEPNPELYARLAALSTMTYDGLSSRGLLEEKDGQALQALTQKLLALKTIAEKELAGEQLSEEEYLLIEDWGTTLEYLTIASADPEDPNAEGRKFIESLDAAVIADVATDPAHGLVLEEGVGRVFEIYVVAPEGDGLQIARGGVFAYYEFTQPLGERLTDEAWKAMLDAGKAPPRPQWTKAFVVE